MRCVVWVGRGMGLGMVQRRFRYWFVNVIHSEGLNASRRAGRFVCGKGRGEGGAGSGKGDGCAVEMGWLVAWGSLADVQVDGL